MNSIKSYLFILTIAIIFITSCSEEPKVISSKEDTSSLEDKTGVFADESTPSNTTKQAAINNDEVHTVVVEEVIPTSKYVYLSVKEGEGESFWIATIKQEVEVGKTYYYKGGLVQTNFESKEHNRIFDKILLVSRVIPVNDNGQDDKTAMNVAPSNKQEVLLEPITREGSIKISELVTTPEKYEGQIVQLSGKCVKINAEIMDRNWIHLKDGSQDDYDLVVTSNQAVLEGQIVTMNAKVILDKDFGAGYRYDLILEEGVIVR